MNNDENTRIYEQYRNQLIQRQLSNSENYDKSILTLSTAVLGLSITFLKDILPANEILAFILLKLSWYMFSIAVLTTIGSFISSQWGIKKQLTYAEKYYLENKPEYLNKKNIFSICTTILNHISGFSFIIGIILTVIFVTSNLSFIRSNKMEQKSKKEDVIKGIEIDNSDTKKFGAEIPKMMQKVNTKPTIIEKGAEIPAMQPIKPSTSSESQNTGGSNNSGNSGSSDKSSQGSSDEKN